MLTVFGIKNCDTMKKAFTWLEKSNIPYAFHDYKKSGIDSKTIHVWLKDLTLDQLINKKGTTWKNLAEAEKASAEDTDKAIRLMINNPSMIKRPLVFSRKGYLLGFNETEWSNNLKA